jgi:L-alanine-DL-glutamate epimerase-like enolase superfamily enzyme
VKIVSIETLLRSEHLALVRVRTDDGAEGIGQTSPYLAQFSTQVLHELLAPHFLGRDPWDHEALVDETVRQLYKFYGTLLFRALCGIDTALWDLRGRVTGQPVYKLLGGTVRNPVPVYASSMSRAIGPEEEAERLLGLVERFGFRGVKIRVGQVMGRDGDAAPGRTERLIVRAREVLGPDVVIHADANGGYSVAQAIRVGRLLEDHGYGHYEEPCPFPQLENTAAVAQALDIAVAGGEQDNSLEQFHRMIERRVVDIVQPDIGYVGGVSRARRVALMAEAAGIPCTPHCANVSLLQNFTLHLAAAMPSISQYQEWSIEDTPWTRDLVTPELTIRDGAVQLSDEPGWGVRVHPDFERDAQVRISR